MPPQFSLRRLLAIVTVCGLVCQFAKALARHAPALPPGMVDDDGNDLFGWLFGSRRYTLSMWGPPSAADAMDGLLERDLLQIRAVVSRGLPPRSYVVIVRRPAPAHGTIEARLD